MNHNKIFILVLLIILTIGTEQVTLAYKNHNIMLRVVRVTIEWMPFTSTSGWTRAVPVKESQFLKFYEVALWEETKSIHFYEFPNDYNPEYGYIHNINDEDKIAYREQYAIRIYKDMPPKELKNQRSLFLKSTFIDIVSYLSNKHPDSEHHFMYNGHGTEGGALIEFQLNRKHTNHFLKFWTESINKPLGVIDMGGPCTKGGFSDLDNFHKYTRYYIASDIPNGGFQMDNFTYEKYAEVDAEHQYHNLFANNETLKDVLISRINLRRKDYEYSRNYMTKNKVMQASYLYDCNTFGKFKPIFIRFYNNIRKDYPVHYDLYQYLIDNNAPQILIDQYNNIIIHEVNNKDFFQWSGNHNGILMPKLAILNPVEDLNKDGVVDIIDLIIAINDFGENTSQSDINQDGKVDILDFTQIANAFTYD